LILLSAGRSAAVTRRIVAEGCGEEVVVVGGAGAGVEEGGVGGRGSVDG
jgi:hypothetical protein